MPKKFSDELRGKIIDLIDQKSTDFSNLFIAMDSLFLKRNYSSFDNFREEFIEYGKFSFWMICEISKYIKNLDDFLTGYNVLNELYKISNFKETGFQSVKALIRDLNQDFSKYLFSLRYIALKVREKQNLPDDIDILFEPVTLFNSYKHYNFEGISNDERKILLDVFHNSDCYEILKDNFEKKEHLCRDDYLNALNSIDYSKYLDWNYSIPRSVTYEEQLLLELFSVKYDYKRGMLHEIMNFGSPWPNISEWDENEIRNLKKYFNNENVDLIIELILNIIAGDSISSNLEMKLLSIVESALSNITSIVPPILGFVCKRKKMFSASFQKKMSQISLEKTKFVVEPSIIENYKDAGVILHPNCLKILKDKNLSIIKTVLATKDYRTFYDALSNTYAFKDATKDDLKKIYNQFLMFEKGNHPELYIKYMKILDSLKSDTNFDVTWVSKEIIKLILYWQNHGYKLSMLLVKEHMFSGPTINIKDVENIQNKFLSNPCVAFFGFENSFNDKNLLAKIKHTSEFSMNIFSDTIYLSPDFPKLKKGIGIEDSNPNGMSKIEKILYPFFDGFIKKNSHHLLNLFPTIVFIRDIIERCCSATLCWGLLNDIRPQILSYIKKSRPASSIGPYHKKPTYADLTMLFPLLEREVLNIGAAFGFPPLITDTSDKFGAPNSPAEMLLKVINKIQLDTGSLYLSSDFIWIYLLMYCREGLNIRNSVIHGNNYPLPSYIINHYYTITLVCVADLIKRNDVKKDIIDE